MMKVWRMGANMSQEELADLTRVSRITISNIETCTYVPNFCLVLDIVSALGMSYAEAFAQLDSYEKTVFNIDSLDFTPCSQ